MPRYESVQVTLDGFVFRVADARARDPWSRMSPKEGLSPHFIASDSRVGHDTIVLDGDDENHGVVRLIEGRQYYWEISRSDAASSADFEIECTLRGHRTAEWFERSTPTGRSGQFKVINYLGVAWIKLAEHASRFCFEIVPAKLDFESEYHAMIDSLAEECDALVMEWSSPTFTQFETRDGNASESLIRQFTFLRHAVGSRRLAEAIDAVRRYPKSVLTGVERWVPAGSGETSYAAQFPNSATRSWSRIPSHRPAEILERHQLESFDTLENRFVKMVLGAFTDLCDKVLDLGPEPDPSFTSDARIIRSIASEAAEFGLHSRVGRLSRIPFESQVLQKREGYRDFLRWWIQLDAAARIRWDSADDVFHAESRNVALMYEYWLFFVMRRCLRSMPGAVEVVVRSSGPHTGYSPLVERGHSAPVINLRSGRTSLVAFDTPASRVHLYYNRSFSSNSAAPLSLSSYSRRLRPDYSIVLLPAQYLSGGCTIAEALVAENRAAASGLAQVFHFDAKYRVDSLIDLFGPEAADEGSESVSSDHSSNEFVPDDLHKMHAYVDAIRSSSAAFVLYPGRGNPLHRFERFQEIVPSVGAVVVRPSRDASSGAAFGEATLRSLLHHLTRATADRYANHYRIRYFAYNSLTDASESDEESSRAQRMPPRDVPVMVLEARAPVSTFADATMSLVRIPLPVIPANQESLLRVAVSATTLVVLPQEGSGWRAEIAACRVATRPDLATHPIGRSLPTVYGAELYLLISCSNAAAISQEEGEVWRRTGRSALSGDLSLREDWSEFLSISRSSMQALRPT